MPTWPILIALASAALNGSIGALAYARGRSQPLYRSFAIMGLSFALWGIAYAGAWPEFADPFWMNLLFSPLSWLPAAILSFVWCYTGLPEKDRRKRTVPLYAAGLLLLGMLWSGAVTLDAYRVTFFIFLFPSIAACVGLLVLHWRKAEDLDERNRRGYMVAAALIAAAGSISDFAPYMHLRGVPPLANVSLMLYSLIVLLAITKHHLLDLSSAARRAGVMIGASLALSLLMSVLAWVTSHFEGPLFLNFFLLSLALLAILPPAWERLNRSATRFFFARQYKRDQALEKLEKALEGAASTETIEKACALAAQEAWAANARLLFLPRSLRGLEAAQVLPEGLQRSLGTEPATLAGLQRQNDAASLALLEAIKQDKAEAAAPVYREGELVAALLLGAPAQGFYDSASLKTLSRFSQAISRAVSSAELTAELLRADRLAQLGQLSAGIAHEVRNPLSAILGAVEVMQLGVSPEKQKDFLAVLKDEVLRLDGTLTELLDYASAKPQNARCEWTQAWGRMEKLVCAELGHTIKLSSSGPPAELAISGGHLQQILLNLVKNAARAAKTNPAPEVKVAVLLSGRTAHISVSDNGPGIPADVLPRLFTAFTTASVGGTGLGLATVRRLAELYGGRAWAENLASGARFSVELPLAEMIK